MPLTEAPPQTPLQPESVITDFDIYPPLHNTSGVAYAPSHEVRNPDLNTKIAAAAGQRATGDKVTVYDVTSTHGKAPNGDRMPPPERQPGMVRSAGGFVLRTLIADKETREFRRAWRDFAPGPLTRFSRHVGYRIREGAATARYKVQNRWERIRYR